MQKASEIFSAFYSVKIFSLNDLESRMPIFPWNVLVNVPPNTDTPSFVKFHTLDVWESGTFFVLKIIESDSIRNYSTGFYLFVFSFNLFIFLGI